MDKIDIEHVLFWMDAIRNAEDKTRVLDAFWKGQIRSKVWLINNLSKFIDKEVSIDIFGGWIGTLSSLLFQSNIPISKIRSIDIDPSCEQTSYTMNKLEEMQGRFKAVTEDMCSSISTADVVINTSCEHITQDQYLTWLNNMPKNSLFVLQSNNYNIPEHIRLANSIEEFINQSNVNVLHATSLDLPLYTRYMIIGKK
jgi:hypothetical protein